MSKAPQSPDHRYVPNDHLPKDLKNIYSWLYYNVLRHEASALIYATIDLGELESSSECFKSLNL
jgi:hypothetical protein